MVQTYQPLFEKLGVHDRIITVNQRLASYLQDHYGAWLADESATVWEADRILSWQAFQENLWQQLTMQGAQLPLIIETEQERTLWDEIIRAHDSDNVLLNTAATAHKAQNAWHTMQAWNLHHSAFQSVNAENVQTFCLWAQAFSQQLIEKNWISRSQQLSILTKQALNGLPQRLFLVGFNELTPQQMAFLDATKQYGLSWQQWQISQKTAPTYAVACHDQDRELRTALTWAKNTISEQRRQNPKSGYQLAIVIPDLQQTREKVERLAESYFGSNQAEAIPYAISGGKPLISYPIIHDLMLLLRMSSLEDYEHISQIIRSPYLVAAESERANRDRLDLLLRRKLPRTTSLASCLKVEGFVESCPILWEILNRFLQLQWPKNASVSAWQRYYLNALAVLGWPGERTLNSAEYQTVTCFYNELTKIEKYQILFESYSCATLLHHLERQLTHCLFQPESPSQVNVQILGVLEISAMQFDEIWVCGLNEEHWPKPANPSPFLPISLQRSLNMPHASAERELHFAKEILSDIQKQCQNLYLSHPVWQEDIHLLPSPLLQQFASETVNLPVWHETDELQKSQLESFEDEYGPALSPDELIDISGGYKFFQDQALCPFKAFAMRRMNVEPFPSFTEQYDHATRGTILHKILENLWQQLKDHSHLLSLSDEQREHIVSNTVLGVLQAWAQRSESLLTRGLAELEQVRLEDLLNEWLKIEVARAPFKVLAQEQTLVTEFAGIPLKIRADRIDQLADGSKIVIDYKSGLVSCKDWADERPKDPQLPLYAILLKAKGIAYAQVRNGNMGIFGISADEPYADGIVNVADNKWCKASDWQELLSIWQKVLSQLAEHFKQGFAKVDPISYEAACRNCGLQSLCRIYESSTLIDVESQ